jgi:hypothetical protein
MCLYARVLVKKTHSKKKKRGGGGKNAHPGIKTGCVVSSIKSRKSIIFLLSTGTNRTIAQKGFEFWRRNWTADLTQD